MMQYLFDSTGYWIAFRVDEFVYDTNGEWIGWVPWDDGYVVDTEGGYLGTIFPGNRLYRITDVPLRSYPGHPGYPGSRAHPGYPGFQGVSPLPPGAEDVQELAS